MRYALLLYRDEETAVSDHEREHREEQLTVTLAILRARGVLADAQRLLPARTARIVRCWDGGDIIVTVGPIAQTREQLTGWIIAECEDLDGTVRLATTIPTAWLGSVEVRPVPGQSQLSCRTVLPDSAQDAAILGECADDPLDDFQRPS